MDELHTLQRGLEVAINHKVLNISADGKITTHPLWVLRRVHRRCCVKRPPLLDITMPLEGPRIRSQAHIVSICNRNYKSLSKFAVFPRQEV